jgi:hypothetical protein
MSQWNIHPSSREKNVFSKTVLLAVIVKFQPSVHIIHSFIYTNMHGHTH